MNNLFTPERCPLCEGGMWKPYTDGTYQFRQGRKSHTVGGQHYAMCDKCGTRGYLPGQRDANQQLIREYQSALLGYISPSDVLAVREKYLLTQEQAGTIFGGGKQGFSKWECGKAAPAGPTARLIKLALKHPDVMRALAADAGVQLLETPSHNRRITDNAGWYHFGPSSNHPVIFKKLDAISWLAESQAESLVIPTPRISLDRKLSGLESFADLAAPWKLIFGNAATYESTSISGQSIPEDAPTDDSHHYH